MQEVARWRVVLGALLDEPETALTTLRARGRPSQMPRARDVERPGALARLGPAAHRRASTRRPPRSACRRVDVDRLLERFDAIERARERIAARAERGHRAAASHARSSGRSLVEALRLIGPPRPWGAPAAALRRIEGVAAALGDLRRGARRRLGAAQHGRARAPRRRGRREEAALDDAPDDGRPHVRAPDDRHRVRGAPQRARGHRADARAPTRPSTGASPSSSSSRACSSSATRSRTASSRPRCASALGKPPSGTIALGARKLGNRLSHHHRGRRRRRRRGRRAGARGRGGPGHARRSPRPPTTTRSSRSSSSRASRRASRAICSPAAASASRSRAAACSGWAAPSASRAARARASARASTCPIESGLVTVLWVIAGKDEFALPAANVRRVRLNDGPDGATSRTCRSCLDGARAAAALRATRSTSSSQGERQGDGSGPPARRSASTPSGETEELLVRPLGPLVAGLGPSPAPSCAATARCASRSTPWAIAPRARAFSAARHGRQRVTAPERPRRAELCSRSGMPVRVDAMKEATSRRSRRSTAPTQHERGAAPRGARSVPGRACGSRGRAARREGRRGRRSWRSSSRGTSPTSSTCSTWRPARTAGGAGSAAR